MTRDTDLQAYFARLAVDGGTPLLDAQEIDAVLDLTKVVAHTAERYYAPLAAYAAGLAIGAGADPAERAARVRALIDVVRRLRNDA
ncbi:MAG: DUF6457 domain-containing protein [Egibacteraceae bacterium]